ncbi:MAG: hypothetical protein JWM82_107 [Myxococcales bacterium]|nr:hypothetical protein [Myxococcales bacterium]
MLAAMTLAASGCAGKSTMGGQTSHPDGSADVATSAPDVATSAPDVAPDQSTTEDAPVVSLVMDAAPHEPVAFDGGTCPTVAPYDDTDQGLIDKCTVPLAAVVGNSLRSALSADGKTWNHAVYNPGAGADPNESSHRDVIIAKGLIVIVGDGGILVSFDGGNTFTVSRAGRFHDAGLAYFQGAIWALTNLGTFSTTDGKTWQEFLPTATLPGGISGDFPANASIAVSPSKLVAISWRTNKWRVFDGTTWKETAFGDAYGSIAKTAFGNSHFLVTGDGCCDKAMYAGLRATSTDGSTWNLLTNQSPGSASYHFGDVLWDGTRFFATATQYEKTTLVSTDGLTWTPRATNQAVGPTAFISGTYVGTQDNKIFSSPDGVTWTLNYTGPGDTAVFVRLAAGRVLR